ncbi:MAG: hypothetical protein RJA22_940 [Verrucomicrobiota bacterium]|jgi:adenine-specific DNA-methyltransferase
MPRGAAPAPAPPRPRRRPPAPAPTEPPPEDEAYLTSQILTYLGNKRALLPFLGDALAVIKARLGRPRLRCLDLFSGSGIVARYLKRHAELLLANDLEAYSRTCNQCYLANASYVDFPALQDLANHLRQRLRRQLRPGFLAELYAPADPRRIQPGERCFYTRRNAMFLDTARQEIARLPAPLQPFLLAPLLARASIHANTAGVFKGFYKNARGLGQFGGSGRDALPRILGNIDLDLPVLSRFECDHAVHQEDANTLVRRLPDLDLAYLDPPYNQHPYGSNYFMLNLLVEYRRPERLSRTSGIPADWRRSPYNRRAEAEPALLDLVDHCPARFILLSYNSEGFLPQPRLVAALRRRGRLQVLQRPYQAFRGSRNLHGRPLRVTEFLYLLERS